MQTHENVHQARIIAAKLEDETDALMQKAFGPEGEKAKISLPGAKDPGSSMITPGGAIGNYTNSSANFRELAHNWKHDKEIQDSTRPLQAALDTTLEKLAEAGDKKPRLTYRYVGFPYGPWTENPYAGDTPKIQAGDVITDPNYVSTSEHKQFIGGGTQAAGKKTSSVHMAIYGSRGVPVARKNVQYSNGSSRELQTSSGRVQEAGQAEVLYPRNSCFRVLSIEKQDESTVRVVLSEVDPAEAAGPKKHAFTGESVGG